MHTVSPDSAVKRLYGQGNSPEAVRERFTAGRSMLDLVSFRVNCSRPGVADNTFGSRYGIPERNSTRCNEEVMYFLTQLAPGFPSPTGGDGRARSGPWSLVQALRQGTETWERSHSPCCHRGSQDILPYRHRSGRAKYKGGNCLLTRTNPSPEFPSPIFFR